MKHVLLPLVLSGAGLLAATGASAQAFPDRPVRLISPFPAAGPLDVAARLYAQRLSERWGKPVVVETRAGATGAIGTDLVTKAAPDGYTLLMTVDLPIVMAPALFKPPYDVKTDLLPVAGIADGMNLLMIHPSTGANTLAEFVAAARVKPGVFTYSSAGNGSLGHLCAEVRRVWEEPEVRQRLSGIGIDPLWMDAAELSVAIDRDLAKWSRVVRDAGVKAD